MKEMDVALICKALGDSNRLEIVKMISDGEKCGCKILEKFSITQPTLSHHMKILVESGLVNDRKEGKWHYYSVNKEVMTEFCIFIRSLCKGTTENESTKKMLLNRYNEQDTFYRINNLINLENRS